MLNSLWGLSWDRASLCSLGSWSETFSNLPAQLSECAVTCVYHRTANTTVNLKEDFAVSYQVCPPLHCLFQLQGHVGTLFSEVPLASPSQCYFNCKVNPNWWVLAHVNSMPPCMCVRAHVCIHECVSRDQRTIMMSSFRYPLGFVVVVLVFVCFETWSESH